MLLAALFAMLGHLQVFSATIFVMLGHLQTLSAAFLVMHRRTADFSATLFVMLCGLQILSAPLLMVNLQIVTAYAIILIRINKEVLADKEQNCDCDDTD